MIRPFSGFTFVKQLCFFWYTVMSLFLALSKATQSNLNCQIIAVIAAIFHSLLALSNVILKKKKEGLGVARPLVDTWYKSPRLSVCLSVCRFTFWRL